MLFNISILLIFRYKWTIYFRPSEFPYIPLHVNGCNINSLVIEIPLSTPLSKEKFTLRPILHQFYHYCPLFFPHQFTRFHEKDTSFRHKPTMSAPSILVLIPLIATYTRLSTANWEMCSGISSYNAFLNAFSMHFSSNH